MADGSVVSTMVVEVVETPVELVVLGGVVWVQAAANRIPVRSRDLTRTAPGG